ncbi:hypothetical protein [Rhodococcus sp. IEGM 1408]|uniref:hypothetical protein n=1 Tax=Rhodococcus sp. IEGM 1408 TaxID=3082220 RepID=UPI002954D4CD|nr:hypothetical protein [Rhodococcus sp. IEGM 1408]MDV8002586.1 hypothetical protein [Rhodococcus sp. IEGM 1408]
MKFDELPENWTHLPLDDAPLAAGVIDLILGYADRLRNSMLVLPCDHYDVGLPAPLVVGETDWSETYAERRRGLAVLPQLPAAGFVVAVSSRRRLASSVVRGWLRSVEDVLDASGQSLLAFGVADTDSVVIVGGRAARNGSLGAMAG